MCLTRNILFSNITNMQSSCVTPVLELHAFSPPRVDTPLVYSSNTSTPLGMWTWVQYFVVYIRELFSTLLSHLWQLPSTSMAEAMHLLEG